MARRVHPFFWIGLGGAALAIAYSQRSSIMLFGSRIVDAAHDSIFQLQLPDYAQDYSDAILQVSREQGVDPFLIFALGDRETNWGSSIGGPAGTGDGGHGRGLMQIDDRSFAAWLKANDWTDPYTNISKGVEILKGNISFFSKKSSVASLTNGTLVYLGPSPAAKRGVTVGNYPDLRPLTGMPLWDAAVAAYNTGAGNVLRNLAAGLPAEFTTTGGDYTSDVVARATTAAQKYDAAIA